MIIPVLSLIILIVTLASWWVIFNRAGKPGWGSVVPIYNLVLLLKIVEYPLWCLLLLIVPIVNGIAYLFILYRLGKKFGQSDGFCWGLVVLSPVFLPLLAFKYTDAQYIPEAKGI